MPTARATRARRALLERLWASGMDTREIAVRMGWSPKHPAATYIAVQRMRGANLPHRDDEDVVRARREGRWPDKH